MSSRRNYSLCASVPLWFVALFVAPSLGFAQTATTSKTRAHVQTLAAEKFEGREAGTPGERLAGDYIAAQLARLGAKPLPGRPDMFAAFEFTAGSKDGGSIMRVTRRPPSQPPGAAVGGVSAV